MTVSVADLEKAISRAGGKLLETVEVFDEYKGKNVPEGQRSLAFNLVYRSGDHAVPRQSRDRTLTDKDVDPVHQKVRDTLVKKFAVTLRS